MAKSLVVNFFQKQAFKEHFPLFSRLTAFFGIMCKRQLFSDSMYEILTKIAFLKWYSF